MWDTIRHGWVWQGEIRNRRKDGGFYWVETTIVPFLDESGLPYQYVSVRTDITTVKEHEALLQRSKEELERLVQERTQQLARTNEELLDEIEERKRAEELLEKLAITDPLTGVANRRRFNALLDIEIKRADRFRTPLALVLFDIDHFKRVNDTRGHPVGDRVLKELTELVGLSVRAYDTVARWGGEEFAILIPNSDIEGARQLAEKIRQRSSATRFPRPAGGHVRLRRRRVSCRRHSGRPHTARGYCAVLRQGERPKSGRGGDRLAPTGGFWLKMEA